MDRRAQGPRLLRLRHQLSDRHGSRRDRRCRGDPSHPAGGSWGRADDDRADGDPLRHEARLLAADSAYGSAESLDWLVKQKEIKPFIPVIDKSNRTDGTFARDDFVFDPERDRYTCPAGKELIQYRRTYSTPRSGVSADGPRFYRATKLDCDACGLKSRCCPDRKPARCQGTFTRTPGTRLALSLQRLNTRTLPSSEKG